MVIKNSNFDYLTQILSHIETYILKFYNIGPRERKSWWERTSKLLTEQQGWPYGLATFLAASALLKLFLPILSIFQMHEIKMGWLDDDKSGSRGRHLPEDSVIFIADIKGTI
jgi:hypothetical protein